MYQTRILPYFIIPSTFSPQASSPLERSGRTDIILHPLLLLPKFFFFPLSAWGTHRRNSTGLAELWGGLLIKLVPYYYILYNTTYNTYSWSRHRYHCMYRVVDVARFGVLLWWGTDAVHASCPGSSIRFPRQAGPWCAWGDIAGIIVMLSTRVKPYCVITKTPIV